jgi:Putative citrate transport
MSAFSPGWIVRASLFASLMMMTTPPAMAGEALDGARLPWPLALPFAGILLSIALGPLAVKEWWHIHYAKAAGFWAVLALGGLITVEGLPATSAAFVHRRRQGDPAALTGSLAQILMAISLGAVFMGANT